MQCVVASSSCPCMHGRRNSWLLRQEWEASHSPVGSTNSEERILLVGLASLSGTKNETDVVPVVPEAQAVSTFSTFGD